MSTKLSFTPLVSCFILLSFMACLTSCEERFATDPGLRLSFSTDTLSFDTVFSTIKSPTKRIMVTNPHKQALRIDRITLEGGRSSYFQVNADGEAGSDIGPVEISARDSAYVFVAVRVERLGQDAPLRIEDRLTFHLNGFSQQVVLETYGQDAEIWRGKTIAHDTTLTARKPYIIYDSLSVAPGKRLTIAPGCRLYFHNNANLFVYGQLDARGTREQPIVMRGDRFDSMNYLPPVPYNDVAGQWGGLYLYGAGLHRMEHVHINSGYTGVFLSYNGQRGIPSPEEMPRLDMRSCRLHNFIRYGLVAQNADLTVSNSVLSNTGSYTVYLNGGTHCFVHTTVANYFGSGDNTVVRPATRNPQEPAVMIMNLNKTAAMHTEFVNCAIAGNMDTEFSLAARVPDRYDGTFSNTYFKRDTLRLPQFGTEAALRWYTKEDILFRSTEMSYREPKAYDFEPDSTSVLLGLADVELTRECDRRYGLDGTLQYDFNGTDRYVADSIAAGACEWRATGD